MLVIFVYEVMITEYTSEDDADRLISSFPTMPVKAMQSIENLEMIDFEILQEMERGKSYGNLDDGKVYFVWELLFPITPSIGWMFSCPSNLGWGTLNTITNIYFGTGNVLLCKYE